MSKKCCWPKCVLAGRYSPVIRVPLRIKTTGASVAPCVMATEEVFCENHHTSVTIAHLVAMGFCTPEQVIEMAKAKGFVPDLLHATLNFTDTQIELLGKMHIRDFRA